MRALKSFTPIGRSLQFSDSTASRPDTYPITTWVLESKPLTVQFSADLLFKLRTTLIPKLEAQPRLCPGGLLLGTCMHSQSWSVEIRDYVPLEWDVSRGGAPFLTEAQSHALQDKLASDPGDLSIVGLYRCSRAVDREKSHHSSDGLVGTRRPVVEADRSLLSLCSRLGVVSVGLRLDLPDLLPHGTAFWEDSNVYELIPSGAKLLAPKKQAASESASHFDEKSPTLRSQSVPDPASAMSPAEIGQPNQRTSFRSIVWFIGTILISVLTYVGAHFFLKPFIVQVAGKIYAGEESGRPAATLSRDTLGLKVNQGGSALELSWGPTSPLMKLAQSGKLFITDGVLSRELAVSHDQLVGGKIVYTPLDGDVTFRLEMMDSESHVVTESVRVVRGVPLPGLVSSSGQLLNRQNPSLSDLSGNHMISQQPALPAVHHSTTVLRSSAVLPQIRPETTVVVVPNAPAPAPPPALSPAVNPSIVPVQENHQPVRDQKSVSVAAPAPLLTSPLRLPLTLSLSQPNVAFNANTPRETHNALDLSAVNHPVATPKTSKPMTYPQVLVERTPDLLHNTHPPLFRDLFINVVVNIDEQGKVTSAALEPMTGGVPLYFANQALSAARLWRFSPAKLEGRPTRSEMVIKFHFKPMS